jgi:hypothetical protein
LYAPRLQPLSIEIGLVPLLVHLAFRAPIFCAKFCIVQEPPVRPINVLDIAIDHPDLLRKAGHRRN